MRIDIYLTKNGFADSRAKAQRLLEEGMVSVNGKIVTRASKEIVGDEAVELFSHKEYVSRGALKLEAGIKAFNLDFSHRIVLDMGASTGGFTQVALENGATKVYAVDVGKNQLSESLRKDERVISLESQDVRTLDKHLVQDVDMIVGDLSFISLNKVLAYIKDILGNKEMCLLFKPQFECGKDIAKKYRGVIKDEKLHQKLLEEFCVNISQMGFTLSGLAPSPIKGGDGNREYLIYLNGKQKECDILKTVKANFDR